MKCQWQQINRLHWKCVKCGTERTNYSAPPKRECSVNKYIQCQHRSANSVRTVQCASCGGNVQIKVFDCSVHKECTLSKKLNGIACCESCKDFKTS